MTVAPKCLGGRCYHTNEEHWCLFPVLLQRAPTPYRSHGFVATRASIGTHGRSGGHQAFLVHRADRVAAIWREPSKRPYQSRDGKRLILPASDQPQLVVIGARWLCGASTCNASRIDPEAIPEGFILCARCEQRAA